MAPQVIHTSFDAGLNCLVLIARYHGLAVDPAQISHEVAAPGVFSEADLMLAAKRLQLRVRLVRIEPRRLAKAPLPALMLDSTGQHFVLASVSDNGNALIQEANAASPQIVTQAEVLNRSHGRALLLASRASVTGELARFDFSWFVPALVKYRRLLLEIFTLSAILQLVGLIWPLMFQVVMDKVLVNRALSTLEVVCVALVLGSIFESLLAGIRTYILAHTTSRMDVELGTRLFRHLLALPIGYFSARRIGDTVTRVRELESIRNFLTGQALGSLLDLIFSLFFIGILFLYSVYLTLIVVASLPIYALLSGWLNPLFRERLNRKFARSADTQSLLVESIAGIETIKSMAVEPQFNRRWDQQLAAYVGASFHVTTLANLGQQLVQLVGKLVNIALLFFGARLVLAGRLTVGELIAFNMIAQRVASPVIRLAQLWQDFQQIAISVQRLGDILNVRTEIAGSRQTPPAVIGEIAFENVFFKYKAEAPLVLKGINLRIAPGQVVGIVGRSGSGKSTLAKLIQRLYSPEQGWVSVDGHDLALCDPAWIRRQIGVVPQENVLFNRSIRENIALTIPGASLDQVIAAAKLAGIHESVIRLPEGYDTRVGDNGCGLSGGQKQRIAIARVLLGDPRILIFDEATSALDYETERTIQQNMRQISRGRTVIIIAHRLTAVRHADRILALDQGQIVETGQHEDLLARRGYYANLVLLQNQGA